MCFRIYMYKWLCTFETYLCFLWCSLLFSPLKSDLCCVLTQVIKLETWKIYTYNNNNNNNNNTNWLAQKTRDIKWEKINYFIFQVDKLERNEDYFLGLSSN